jgi:hypothetical protein
VLVGYDIIFVLRVDRLMMGWYKYVIVWRTIFAKVLKEVR